MPKPYLHRAVTVFAALSCVLLAGVAPAAAIETDDLVAVFQGGTHVYVEANAEAVDQPGLEASVEKASSMGYDLYIAVLGPDSLGVDNAQVRKALGGVTVATWNPGTYRISSDQICRDALNRADQQAKANVAISYPPDQFMAAFVAALETTNESCAAAGAPGWLRILLIAMGLAAIGLLIIWLVGRGQAKAAETRRADEFRERRTILKDWSDTLQEPLEELGEPVKASGNAEYQTMYDEAKKVASNAEADIEGAKALPDLDRAEIRIARAQMQIRDLYEALPDVSR